MATQIVMDHTGDTRHQFDPVDAAAVAEVRFKELTGAGFREAAEIFTKVARAKQALESQH
jgi:hypothetical protein